MRRRNCAATLLVVAPIRLIFYPPVDPEPEVFDDCDFILHFACLEIPDQFQWKGIVYWYNNALEYNLNQV